MLQSGEDGGNWTLNMRLHSGAHKGLESRGIVNSGAVAGHTAYQSIPF